ncbi:GFA family protein [Roseovarius salinarum]|uniref:GFA family protein n=1 Tax=Roseovarius salinarum TaxID=1981892 RepID=UPI00130004AC|nr:GFA family protein [Roseovarius salinarum]
MTRFGYCLCGSVTFELLGSSRWVGHCHCASCRRATGAGVVTFIGHPNGAWRWTGAPPSSYASSPGTLRYFCPVCGASVAYGSSREPGETHFHAALLDDPGSIIPTDDFHADERLGWIAPGQRDPA